MHGRSACIEITGLRSPCVKIERLMRGLRRAVTLQFNGHAAVRGTVLAVVLIGGLVSAGDDIRIVRNGDAALQPV